MARRFDEGRLDAPVRTPQGFLRVPASIARIGVQMYSQDDGTVRREYRPPDEVFKADALASFALAPITLTHPPEAVTAANVAEYGVGTMGETLAASGDLVCGTALITHADAIEAVERGQRELSCGYECDLDFTAGTAPDGQKYDAIQRNIRGNHVAIVRTGRAGPAVRLRLDANDNAVPGDDAPSHQQQQEKSMAIKIKIDGVEVEVPEVAAQLIKKHDDDKDEEIAKLKARISELEGAKKDLEELTAKEKEEAKKDAAESKATAQKEAARADTEKARADAAEKARADAAAPEALAKVVAARVKLEKACALLAPAVKADGLDDMALRTAALKAAGVDVTGKAPAYIEARFDGALEQLGKTNPAAAVLAAGPTAPPTAEEKKKQDEAAANGGDARATFMASQAARSKSVFENIGK
jgi:hypothetical protein